MKVSADWLAEYIDKKLSTREMAEALERAGIEVEQIIYGSNFDSKILVGKVDEVTKHPNADKLRLAQVSVGSQKLSIVCGAPNIAPGQTVAVALVGAELPDGVKIGAAKIRGQASEGMICSEKELGISDSHEGIMVLDNSWKSGSKLSQYLQQSDVIDVTTQANRWDLQSVVGLAREIAAQVGSRLNLKSGTVKQIGSLKVNVAGGELAKRYLLAEMEVLESKSTPDFVTARLVAAGIRPISLIVDITNYVMLELGQPLHAFDADKVSGALSVRNAKTGEKMITLDGKTRTLSEADIVIADSKSAIGLAGVMGGENSEISESTSRIYLESATFNGAALRKTAVRYGLRTDASARFERGLPVEVAEAALARAIELIRTHAGGNLINLADEVSVKPSAPVAIKVSSQKVSELLGFEVKDKEIASEIKKLGFEFKPAAKDLAVTPPWWRADVKEWQDIAEEVMRQIGYDKLPANLPSWQPTTIKFDRYWSNVWKAKSALKGLGLFEVATYSFIGEDQLTSLGYDPAGHLKLANPASVEQAYLRLSMLPSLLGVVERNRNYAKSFGLYEISKLYSKTGEGKLPNESTRVASMVYAPKEAYLGVKQVADVLAREFNIAFRIEPQDNPGSYPGRFAFLWVGDEKIGGLGEFHPQVLADRKIKGSVGFLEIDIKALFAASQPKEYREISKFPSIQRDVSVLLADDVLWQNVSAALYAKGFQAVPLDDYRGSDVPRGHKAVTIRFTFASMESTLTDSEADAGEREALALLKDKFDAKPRD